MMKTVCYKPGACYHNAVAATGVGCYPARLPPSRTTIDKFFPGFSSGAKQVDGVEIPFVTAGSGPPLLLAHGHPQSRVIWQKVAPALARRFTVVASDLRGYGDASKPPGVPDHSTYIKREMARDQYELMLSLGFDKFSVVAHDGADRNAGRKIACPLRVLWGKHGVIERCFEPLKDWSRVAAEMSGRALDCGHYIPEEAPAALLAEIEAFF